MTADDEEVLLVTWDDKYSVGIPLIDEQHKELINLTNELYQGCRTGTEEEKRAYFLKTVKSAVEYVKYHFSAEEKMLENIKYPKYAEHKRQHEAFIQRLLADVKSYQEGMKLVPNSFVRFLRDWILSHIAMEDTQYARYILDLKKKGQLQPK
ncbi:MAG: bacteriohemerythrin [Spirochaetaceae bacterium]|jgi:hemerythrin|nr:bacteriohemerythrin [Spirochaetaceae bacterium]